MDLDEDRVREHLAGVMEEHRDLDGAIEAVLKAGTFNLLQVQRMKKRKLSLKDEIGRLQSLLLPDIIA